MFCAKRQSDGQSVTAYLSKKSDGPFLCLECGDAVILKLGRGNVDHFAHLSLLKCSYAAGESEAHRYCKFEIYESLLRTPGVTDVAMERSLGSNRPDVSAYIHGVPVAIEVQISSLSVEAVMRRTIEYHRKGIYVLWLLQWKPELDSGRYTPKVWEKWLHAAYFGRVYYWKQGLEIARYTFTPNLKSVPKKSWYDSNGRLVTWGGYTRRLKRFNTAVAGPTFNLAKHFGPKERFWWEGNGVKIPDARIYMERHSHLN